MTTPLKATVTTADPFTILVQGNATSVPAVVVGSATPAAGDLVLAFRIGNTLYVPAAAGDGGGSAATVTYADDGDQQTGQLQFTANLTDDSEVTAACTLSIGSLADVAISDTDITGYLKPGLYLAAVFAFASGVGMAADGSKVRIGINLSDVGAATGYADELEIGSFTEGGPGTPSFLWMIDPGATTDGVVRLQCDDPGPFDMDVAVNVQLLYLGAERVAGPGEGGGGGGLTVTDDDTAVTIDPTTTLDFAGSGVLVSDAGGGLAQVFIPALWPFRIVPVAAGPVVHLDDADVALVDTTGGAHMTVDLPDAAVPNALAPPKVTVVSLGTGDVQVNVAAFSGQTIDGVSPGFVGPQQSTTFVSDGANWVSVGGRTGIGDYASAHANSETVSPGTTGATLTWASFLDGDAGSSVGLAMPTDTFELNGEGLYSVNVAVEVTSVSGGTIADVTEAWFQPNFVSGGFSLVGCPRGWFGVRNDDTGLYLQANALIRTTDTAVDITWDFGLRGAFTTADFTGYIEIVRLS